MTATAAVPVAVRLRHLAETSPGRRVLVDRDDLLALLDAPRVADVPDLDALTGHEVAEPVPTMPGHMPAPRASAPHQPPPGRGRGHIALAATIEDAKRLARAAWDTDENRVAEHGRFDVAEPGPTWAIVLAALAALQHLTAVPR